MHRRRLSTAIAATAIAALAAVGCADNKGSSGGSSAGKTTATTVDVAAVNTWALDYTHGNRGKADPSLEPVVVGYVNQEGGVPAFPEATAGTEAAVAYGNNELGGVAGHKLVR